MYKKLSLAVAISAAIGLQGCHLVEGDSSSSRQGQVETENLTLTVTGTVKGSDGQALPKGTTVTVGGKTKPVDVHGYFSIPNVPATGLSKGERDVYTHRATVRVNAPEGYVSATIRVPLIAHLHDSVSSTDHQAVAAPNTVTAGGFEASLGDIQLRKKSVKVKGRLKVADHGDEFNGVKLNLIPVGTVAEGTVQSVDAFHNKKGDSNLVYDIKHDLPKVTAAVKDGRFEFEKAAQNTLYRIVGPTIGSITSVEHQRLGTVQLPAGQNAVNVISTVDDNDLISIGEVFAQMLGHTNDFKAPYVEKVVGVNNEHGMTDPGDNTFTSKSYGVFGNQQDITTLQIKFNEKLQDRDLKVDNQKDILGNDVVIIAAGKRLKVKKAEVQNTKNIDTTNDFTVLNIELDGSLREQLKKLGFDIPAAEAVEFTVNLKTNRFTEKHDGNPYTDHNRLTAYDDADKGVHFDRIAPGTEITGGSYGQGENNEYLELALRTDGNLKMVKGQLNAQQLFTTVNNQAFDTIVALDQDHDDVDTQNGLQLLNANGDNGLDKVEQINKLVVALGKSQLVNGIASNLRTARISYAPLDGVSSYKVEVLSANGGLAKHLVTGATDGAQVAIRLPEQAANGTITRLSDNSDRSVVITSTNTEFLLENVLVGDIVRITAQASNLTNTAPGTKLVSEVELQDKVAPFPVLQEAYNYTNTIGGVTGSESVGRGAELVVEGVDGKKANLALPLTPRLLGKPSQKSYKDSTAEERRAQYSINSLVSYSDDLHEEDRFADLEGVAVVNSDNDLAVDVTNLGIYSEKGFKEWEKANQGGKRSIGVAVSENVSLVEGANPSFKDAEGVANYFEETPWSVQNNRGLGDNADNRSGSEDLVSMHVHSVANFANAVHGKALQFGGAIQDMAGNVATENAVVVAQDKIPALVTSAVYTGTEITIVFNEAIDLTPVNGVPASVRVSVDANGKGGHAITLTHADGTPIEGIDLSKDRKTLEISYKNFDRKELSFARELLRQENSDKKANSITRLAFDNIRDAHGNAWSDFYTANATSSSIDAVNKAWFTAPLFALQSELEKFDVYIDVSEFKYSNNVLSFDIEGNHPLSDKGIEDVPFLTTKIVPDSNNVSYVTSKSGSDIGKCDQAFTVSVDGDYQGDTNAVGELVSCTIKDLSEPGGLPNFRVEMEFASELSGGYKIEAKPGKDSMYSAWHTSGSSVSDDLGSSTLVIK